MTDQERAPKWAFRNAPNNSDVVSHVVMRHGGDIGNLSRTPQTEELLADANAGAAMQGIRNPSAIAELVEALKDIATSDERGICDSGYGAQRIALDALDALDAEESN